MADEKNGGDKKKKRTKKTKAEREKKWEQEYLQIWEIHQITGISISKIKYAIKIHDLKSRQNCERGMHLVHKTEMNRWVDGRKGK